MPGLTTKLLTCLGASSVASASSAYVLCAVVIASPLTFVSLIARSWAPAQNQLTRRQLEIPAPAHHVAPLSPSTVIALVSSDSREGVAETSVGVDAASAGSEPSSISCIVH